MISDKEFIRLSLESNLFFLRIVKEHNYFAAASLPPKGTPISMQLIAFNRTIEKLLSMTIALSYGNLSKEVLASGELVTKYTLSAEEETQFLTGIPIDTTLTKKETNFGYINYYQPSKTTFERVSRLNIQILKTVNYIVNFQKKILNDVLSCKSFGYTYPLNVHHIIRETQVYLSLLNKIQNKEDIDASFKSDIEQEIFWNDIMKEHSKFIRGYLDPSENDLFKTANHFAEEFDALEKATKNLLSQPAQQNKIKKDSIDLTTELRNFKIEGTTGLLACKIKAIMPSLLADHVTREANHYLRLLQS